MNRTTAWLARLGTAALMLVASAQTQAANVAFWSPGSYSASQFPALGGAHTVTDVTTANIDAGALAGYDVLVMGHINQGDPTASTCTQLASFLAAGKGIVSEWNGATVLFQPAPGAYYPVTNPCNLFAGTASGGDDTFGTNLPINIVLPASPLVAGLSNPFAMAGGSEFVYRLTGLGPEWSVAATFDGAGTPYPAVLSAVRSGGGCVALSPFDYFDARSAGGSAQSNMETLLNNMVAWAARGPASCGRAPVAAVQPVPTLETPLLAVLAGVMGLCGAWLRRRRRA